MRTTATIRRWTDRGWGIANAYPDRRFFVHVSQAVSKEVELALTLGAKITFEVGTPRNPGELPTALDIELASITARQAAVNGPVAPVMPSLIDNNEKGGAL